MIDSHICPDSQTLETIDKMREGLNASRPQCPVGLTTLRFPSQLEVRLLLRLLSCIVETRETYIYIHLYFCFQIKITIIACPQIAELI